MTSPQLHWIRAGDHYPDLKDKPDDFIALDGETEVGVVTWIESGPDPAAVVDAARASGASLPAADERTLRDAGRSGA